MARLFLLALATAHAHTLRHTPTPQHPYHLLAAKPAPEPTPAAKLLDVGAAAATETLVLLCFLRTAAALVASVSDARAKFVFGQLAWFLVVQGSSRLQGIVQKPDETLSPEWYGKVVKPSWNPPAWLFPVMWIPLKLAQTVGAGIAWRALDHKVFRSPAIIAFVMHLTLGDVWNSQFFVKQRILTGLLVIYSFWGVLVAATALLTNVSPVAGALVAPTVAWVFVAAALNLDIWYLNRSR
uniref:Uncharacterized protein n=1 Tax=Calcidiscus leptoporus TaxID=127549 RepID=A0A7S0IPT2_9EUKA|mmetsp:Transcript_16362/g.37419  ORF Transcript_16362/g.37419 Transcript_16362/m.37419 type:complete len:239 (+) Transcript_16362:90-806(+)|eukprot:CAMPEP_0119376694 /NCGR_PEP_ID=MMETSP1334-20130426/40804_1 /TAXON_ID=127549 /ORGANISM="Calcidiscus leptoporus, Strain RCC1130" /LENGTH=238 /DNA_ID=CAMNT_0007395333 /DNA_START=64 /DNA_END=780 /DNA_ORIENTATION=-